MSDKTLPTTDLPPGPWYFHVFESGKGPDVHVHWGVCTEPDLKELHQYFAVSDGDIGDNVEQAISIARLIAAAGTAAHEAREMGFDPIGAVEALPKALQALQEVLTESILDDGICGLCGSDDPQLKWHTNDPSMVVNGPHADFHEEWCPVHKVAAALTRARKESDDV